MLKILGIDHNDQYQISFSFEKLNKHTFNQKGNVLEVDFETRDKPLNFNVIKQVLLTFPKELQGGDLKSSGKNSLKFRWILPEAYNSLVSLDKNDVVVSVGKNIKKENAKPSEQKAIETKKQPIEKASDVKKEISKKENKSEKTDVVENKEADTKIEAKEEKKTEIKEEIKENNKKADDSLNKEAKDDKIASSKKEINPNEKKQEHLNDDTFLFDLPKDVQNMKLTVPQVLQKAVEKKESHVHGGHRSATLAFSWNRAGGIFLSVFKRNNYVWILFNRKNVEVNLDLVKKQHPDIIYEVAEIPMTSNAKTIRLLVAPNYNPRLRQEGKMWIVDLRYQPISVKNDIPVLQNRKDPSSGPSLFVPLPKPPPGTSATLRYEVFDPEMGDFMNVFPLGRPGEGMSRNYRYVDAEFLATAQGVVVISHDDNVKVTSTSEGIEVKRVAKIVETDERGKETEKVEKGIHLSSETILKRLEALSLPTDPLQQILNVGSWGPVVNGKAFYNFAKSFNDAIINAKTPKGKQLARLRQARYYFANSMYPEAMGVIRLICADDPEWKNYTAIKALRGAVNFMMQRYKEALVDFEDHALDHSKEGLFWRAATRVALTRIPEVFLADLNDNAEIITQYPQLIKSRLALAGVHSAIPAKSGLAIRKFMDAADSKTLPRALKNEYDFYHALWEEEEGQFSQALYEMRKLSESEDYFYHAMAGLETIRMATDYEDMPYEERVRDLERLSYAWRGDGFEYSLLTLLVKIYVEKEDFSQVLHTLKDMQSRFGHLDKGKQIPDLMKSLFEDLFLTEKGKNMTPLKAVALYNEFPDLLPDGEKGSIIINQLSDKLVAMDLLDKAADLLKMKIELLKKEENHGVLSTRLALVQLLSHKSEDALKTLDAELGENEKLSDKLIYQRKHIKAKALADLKRVDEAIEVLDGDDTLAAKNLRAEIYWQAQIWDKAADALRELINKPESRKQLTDEEAQKILNWSAALRLAGRPKVVMRVRDNFMSLMEKTKLAKAFDFITKSPEQGIMDYHKVSDEVEAVESFHSFAKDYLGQMKTNGLSNTVKEE
ncbi:MAG: hypothetical protein MJ247_07755 [Alphaproteobacteria bacterium]|nr:hypothetical protein [Alphaproteobacteria bacterium]